jgi:hypothetical protein
MAQTNNKQLTPRIIPPQFIKSNPVIYFPTKIGGTGTSNSTTSTPGKTKYVVSNYVTQEYVTINQP